MQHTHAHMRERERKAGDLSDVLNNVVNVRLGEVDGGWYVEPSRRYSLLCCVAVRVSISACALNVSISVCVLNAFGQRVTELMFVY